MSSINRRILHDMLALPTAPFAEHVVIDYIERFCSRRRNLVLTRDAAGNVLVHVRRGSRRVSRPVCITAHLDHPGFVAERMTGPHRLRAKWRGGVPKEYFVGAGVRFFAQGMCVKGRITSIKTVKREGREHVDRATLYVADRVPPGSIGMWDFPDAMVRGSRIYARGCDDLAGAAALLCAIDELTRRQEGCEEKNSC